MRRRPEHALFVQFAVVVKVIGQDRPVRGLDDDRLEISERLERFGNGKGGGEVGHPVRMVDPTPVGKPDKSVFGPRSIRQVGGGQGLLTGWEPGGNDQASPRVGVAPLPWRKT